MSIQKSRFILTHYGVLKTCWDVVILFATVYVAVIVPYYAAFSNDHGNQYMDIVVGTLFVCGKYWLQLNGTIYYFSSVLSSG